MALEASDLLVVNKNTDGSLAKCTVSDVLSLAGPSGVVTIQDDAPDLTNYDEGQLWWSSADGNMYVKYVDADGEPGQWVPVVSSSGGGGSPTDSQLDYVMFDTSEEPIVFTVTVGDKTSANHLFGIGSDKCYYLNGVEAPNLILGSNRTYIFDQSDASNTGLPLVFYKYNTNLINDLEEYTWGVVITGSPGTDGKTQIKFTSRDDSFLIPGFIGKETQQVLNYHAHQDTGENHMGNVLFFPGTTLDSAQGSGGGSIDEAPVDGTTYGRKDAAWSRLVNDTTSDFESALIPDTDSFTVGDSNVQMNTEVLTQFTGVAAAKVESRWWQFDGDSGETVNNVVPVYTLPLGSQTAVQVHEWLDHIYDRRLSFGGNQVDPNIWGIYKSDLIAETRVTYIDGTQVTKWALNSCKVTRL